MYSGLFFKAMSRDSSKEEGIFGNSPNFDQSFGLDFITGLFSESYQLTLGKRPTIVLKSDMDISRLFSDSILLDVASANLAFA